MRHHIVSLSVINPGYCIVFVCSFAISQYCFIYEQVNFSPLFPFRHPFCSSVSPLISSRNLYNDSETIRQLSRLWEVRDWSKVFNCIVFFVCFFFQIFYAQARFSICKPFWQFSAIQDVIHLLCYALMGTCRVLLTRNLAPHSCQEPSRVTSIYVGFESNLLLLLKPFVSHFLIDFRCYPPIHSASLLCSFSALHISFRFSSSSLHWVKRLHS